MIVSQQQGMYLWLSLCTLCWLACQVRVIVGDLGLCCCCWWWWWWPLLRSAIYSLLSSRLITLFVAYDSKWVTVAFFIVHFFENPLKWWTYSDVWLLHCWCYVKLLPSQGILCTHTNMHHVTWLHAKPRLYGAFMFNSCLPPALLAEWPESVMCYCG